MATSSAFNLGGALPGLLNTQTSTPMGYTQAPGGSAVYPNPLVPIGQPQVGVSSLGSLSGLLTPPAKPTTPIKNQTVTTPTGQTISTTYHAPEVAGSTTSTSPAPKAGLITSVDQASKAGAYDAQNGAGSYNASGGAVPPPVNPVVTPNPTTPPVSTPTTPFGASVANIGTQAQTGSQNILNAAQNNPDVQKAIANINAIQTNEANSIASNASTPQEIGVGTGRQQILQNQYGQILNAGQTQLQNALTSQGYNIGAAENAAGLTTGAAGTQAGYTAPQAYGLTTQPYNPTTDTYGGGGSGGAINRAVQASNIGSAQDFQNKINTTQAQANSADANFSILNSIAAQGGASPSSPILSALLQKFGQTVGGQDAPAVAQFKAQLQAVRAAWSALGLGDANAAIPDNITPAQLTQIQQTLKSSAQNNIAGYQNQLNSLGGSTGSYTNNSNSSSANGSTFSGAAWK